MGEKTLFIGVGGCGINSVERLINGGIEGAFLCIGTDKEHLNAISEKALKIPLPEDFSLPLPEPELARIRDLMRLSDRVFLFAGLGGHTGSTLAPYLSEMGTMDIYFTYPFELERGRRKIAESTLPKIRGFVHIRANDDLLKLPDSRNIPLSDYFRKMDNALLEEIEKELGE